jgi:hypothetical protein
LPSAWLTKASTLQLTRSDERGWRATFYTTGMEHSPTDAIGTGWERTPWHATQRAAWEEGEPRWLGGGSLLIPDLETTDVHLKGPSAKVQCGAHQQLVPREDRLASVARFAIAWTTPGRSDAVMWQATDMEFAPYVEAEGVIVHLWPRG